MPRKIAIALLLFAALLTPSSSLFADEPLKIGLILPLSGAHAKTAEAMRNAAELAYSDLPAEARAKIRLLYEDDQLNGAKAVSAFMKLAASDRISAALSFGGQSVGALASLAGSSKIPICALTADSSLVRGHPFVFQHWLSSNEQARAVFSVLKTQLKRVAVISSTHNAALDIRNAFEAQAQARALEVVYKEDFALHDTDLRTAARQLRERRPDAVFTVLVAPHMSLFTSQLRAMKLAYPIYSSANAEVSDEVSAARGAMEGVIYAGPDLDRSFVTRFEEATGRYPEFAAPHVYECIKLFGDAVAHGKSSGSEINDYLSTIRGFTGAMGTYDLIDGYRFGVHAIPKQIKDGKFVKLTPDQPR